MLHESPKSDSKPVLSNLAPENATQANTPPRNATRRCGLCGKSYQVRDPKLAPFCSERCQQVDLGNWLGEAYGLPWEDPAGGETLDRDQDED
jgi:endogenous inhibitor of DNA gyrase (YacG/DUF329 family)